MVKKIHNVCILKFLSIKRTLTASPRTTLLELSVPRCTLGTMVVTIFAQVCEICFFLFKYVMKKSLKKIKSCIWETLNISTCIDSSANTRNTKYLRKTATAPNPPPWYLPHYAPYAGYPRQTTLSFGTSLFTQNQNMF